jgi:hypothetical protein
MRTTTKIVTFHKPFCLKGVDRLLPPADYRVVTDEELIDGATVIFVPAESGSAVEMVMIDPLGPSGSTGTRSRDEHVPSRLAVSHDENQAGVGL